jgi:UDP-N-acetylglucosamine 2-epimerase (non-hydrolysing)
MLKQMDILVAAGARPNFMKIAPILKAMGPSKLVRGRLIHTGQHHDDSMSGNFFRELDIPEPEENLGVGSAARDIQIAEISRKFELTIDKISPRAVLVVGDVNSTLACALAAKKKNIPLIHVEAGLRSFDKTMPEEINRMLTDEISDFLFTTEREADENLVKEGVAREKIHFVGNVMVDCVEHNLERAVSAAETFATHNIKISPSNFALLTLHRPSNVDDPDTLKGLLGALHEIGKRMPVIFPAHPRTKDAITRFSLDNYFNDSRIFLVSPQPYLSMLGLMKEAKIVMTDSGGLQEETTALGVPCFTLRENTERWITVKKGTNTMVGTSPQALLWAFEKFMKGETKKGVRPELWDGNASRRIISVLEKKLSV